jgi:transposase
MNLLEATDRLRAERDERVLQLIGAGESQQAIAALLGVSDTVIGRIVHRFRRDGLIGPTAGDGRRSRQQNPLAHA